MIDYQKIGKHVGDDKFLSFLSVAVLALGLLAGIVLVGSPQDLRREAAGDGADLTVQVNGDLVEFGEQFTANIVISTNDQNVAASDIEIKVDPTMFEIVNIAPGGLVKENGTAYGNLDAVTLSKDIDNNNGTARFAVGVPCDPCYLGANPGDGTPACSGTPKCYPTGTDASGVIAVLTLRVKDKTGNANLDLTNSIQVAAVNGGGTDVKRNLTDDSVSVAVSCDYIDYDNNERVQAFDIQQVANRFNVRSGQNFYDGGYDFDKDGVINAFDIQQVANRFNLTCN